MCANNIDCLIGITTHQRPPITFQGTVCECDTGNARAVFNSHMPNQLRQTRTTRPSRFISHELTNHANNINSVGDIYCTLKSSHIQTQLENRTLYKIWKKTCILYSKINAYTLGVWRVAIVIDQENANKSVYYEYACCACTFCFSFIVRVSMLCTFL